MVRTVLATHTVQGGERTVVWVVTILSHLFKTDQKKKDRYNLSLYLC